MLSYIAYLQCREGAALEVSILQLLCVLNVVQRIYVVGNEVSISLP